VGLRTSQKRRGDSHLFRTFYAATNSEKLSASLSRRRPGTQPQLPQQPPHTRMVHPKALALQHRGQSRTPTGRPLLGQAYQGSLEAGLLADPGLIGDTAGRHRQDATERANRELVREHLDDPLSPLRGVCKMLAAFFKISASSVKRPTSRSKSAMRAASWLRCSSRMHTSPARSSKVAFQHASQWDERWCWRHNSALLFVPDSSSRVTWDLKAGVNFRRLDILNSLLHTIVLAFHRCPNFGDNYIPHPTSKPPGQGRSPQRVEDAKSCARAGPLTPKGQITHPFFPASESVIKAIPKRS
jgi:hypothetical protein